MHKIDAELRSKYMCSWAINRTWYNAMIESLKNDLLYFSFVCELDTFLMRF